MARKREQPELRVEVVFVPVSEEEWKRRLRSLRRHLDQIVRRLDQEARERAAQAPPVTGPVPYTLSEDGHSITCERCGRKSFKGADVVMHYCGICRVMLDTGQPQTPEDVERARPLIDAFYADAEIT